MDFNQLNAMKYNELMKLAKEKIGFTKRVNKVLVWLSIVILLFMINLDVEFYQDKLIKQLMDSNWLSDDSSANEESSTKAAEGPAAPVVVQPWLSEDSSTDERDGDVKGRGKKRVKKDAIQKTEVSSAEEAAAPRKKKQRITKGQNLDSTFSVDEATEDEAHNPPPARISPATRSIRGRRFKKVTSPVAGFKVELMDTEKPEEPAPQPTEQLVSQKEPAPLKLTEQQAPQSVPMEEENLPVPFQEPTVAKAQPDKKIQFRTPTPSTTTRRSESFAARLQTPGSTAKKQPGPGAATPASKTKPRAAPNFALIHQRNFQKMESVDEHLHKKTVRTAAASSVKLQRSIPVFNSSTQIKEQLAPTTHNQSAATASRSLKFDFVSGKKWNQSIIIIDNYQIFYFVNKKIRGKKNRFTKASVHSAGPSGRWEETLGRQAERKLRPNSSTSSPARIDPAGQ